MSKRGRKSKSEYSYEEDDNAKKFAMKWRSVRVFPNEDFTNAMESSENSKYRMNTLDEYIDAELVIQKRIFKHMGCDEQASAKAIAALREAYETSPGKNKK
jgi:hypothetical protein